ncbi:MAG: hypothetical protein HFE77_01795 [Clostridiales bacterium]|nr:hypothetical protein [Clostridiales bacterium]
MFYNSKKLIDEKVLQQYFFEKFMLANAQEMKSLLPAKYHALYPDIRSRKGLQPEVALGGVTNEKIHKTDFVLYPTSSASKRLNIEIKWKKDDFETWRYPYYDGTYNDGFVVCLGTLGDRNDDKINGTDIPVIYLDRHDFEQWFILNAQTIISQALSNKLGVSPIRLTGHKYWVVSVGNKALDHYINFGRKNFIWAFRNNVSPCNIMKILEGDYVIFFNLSYCEPGRMLVPNYTNKNRIKPTTRGGQVKSGDIRWAIGLADVYQVKKGYHLNFGNSPLYSGFETKNWDKRPDTKDYTQYISFYNNSNNTDNFQYRWPDNTNKVLPRELFPDTDANLRELVLAFSQSFNHVGDAKEISFSSFQAFMQLLHAVS